MTRPPWVMERGRGPVVAIALHCGHDLRPEVVPFMALENSLRRREEDPYVDRFTEVAPNRVVVNRSRFEIDLNRPCEDAICEHPDECWDLDVWRQPLPVEVADRSSALHVEFYREIRGLLGEIERENGCFAVIDLHAYNHRRAGPQAPPADPEENPEVNVGTGSMDRARWGHLVDRFIADLSAPGLDVRENVKFRGRELARFVHSTFPESGCCLAVEFKKTFMDEHTGAIDEVQTRHLIDALRATVPGLEVSLKENR